MSLVGVLAVLLTISLPARGQTILGGCLYSLDSSASQAFYITGSTSISSGCSVVVESNNSSAFAIGGTETLDMGNHAKVGVVGGWQLNGNSIIDTMSGQTEQPVTIANPGDPLGSVTAPTQGTIVSPAPVLYDHTNPPLNNTLSPGVYCGGLTIGNPNGVEYTMSAGTYVIAGGGFKVTSSADVVGTGVTIYNTSSAGWGCSGSYGYVPVDIGGQAKLNLSAPSSGPLSGVVVFGDRSGCATPGSCIDNINGQATATFTGNLYFPDDQLIFNGSSTTSGCMGVIADTITVNGNSNFGSQGCSINPITVTVSPQSTVLYANQQQPFTAAVTNTYNTAVSWSISPAGAGSIDANGTYTAPASISTEQTVTVTATSQADPAVSGSATITLFPPVTIALSPATALLYQGQTQQFAAAVGNAFNTAVRWTISPAGVGTIDGTGLYTAPASIASQQTLTVTATSVADTTKSASASIALMPPIAVSLAPASVTLYGSQTQQFTATVINTTNTSVTWSVSPAGVGAVSSGGLYAAPASISSQQTITITATSQADSTKSASATIMLSPPIAVSIAPTADTLYQGQTQQFTANVINTTNTAVTWSISPSGAGTIDATGLYTAPASLSSQQTVTVTATSQADPTKSASAILTLVGQVSVTIAPTPVVLYANQVQTFVANVSNTSNTGVTWTLSPSTVGTLTSSGVYTAPVTISTQQTVTITATSQADTTKSASATVVLMPPLAVFVTPPNAALYANQSQLLTATVRNSSNSAVTWSLTPSGLGTITSAGLYTAPASIASQESVIVTATSQQDSTQSSSAIVTLNPARPAVITTANAGSTYSPTQTVNVSINAQNSGQASATATNVSVVLPNGSVTPLPAFSLAAGQQVTDNINYTVPAIGPPAAPQPLPASTSSSLFNVNLIVNGDAEAAPGALNDSIASSVPGWTRTGNFTTAVYGNCCGFPTLTNPGPPNRGSNFFYGGPSSSSASATQSIDVSSTAGLIDSGFVKYDFSGWLGGYDGQDDNVTVTAAFLDGSGNTLSKTVLGPVTEADRAGITGMLLRSTQGEVPANTRTVSITMLMTRYEGSDNDGYADDLSFVLSGPSSSGSEDPATAAYLSILTAADNSPIPFTVQTSWSDSSGTTYGPSTVQTQATEVLPIAAVQLVAEPQATSGNTITYTTTIQNTGHATASGLAGSITLPDGTVQPLALNATTLAPQASAQATTSFQVPVAQSGGSVFASAAVTWSDAAGNSYGPAYSTASTDVAQLAALLQNGKFTNAAVIPGPYVAGTAETFVATLMDGNGQPVPNITLAFNVNGANSANASAVTDSKGTASFSYTGSNLGIDDVQASVSLGPALLTSNGVQVSWISPSQAVSTTPVTGTFYNADGSGVFKASSATPAAFTQSFPTLGFKPPAGVVLNDQSNGMEGATAFTDVTSDVNSNFSGIVPTRAASGSLTAFQASFTGTLLVTQAGSVTFTVYSDNGFVLGIGNGASAVSGPNVNAPASGMTAISGLPVMGAYNQSGAPAGGSAITVNFAQPGTYPYELDYATTGTGAPNLTFASSANSGLIVPPTGAVLLTPVAVTAQTVGTIQTVNVSVTDQAGNPVPNQSVALTVTGANPQVQDVHTNTDASGNITFTYTGTHAGVDVVQATSLLNGAVEPSNALTVQWGASSSGGPSVSISSNSSVTLPNSLQLTGVATGFGTSYTVSWAKVQGPGTVTFDAPTQLATHASFSASGTYVLQLSVTAGGLTGTAQTTVTVNPIAATSPGWIGNPLDGAQVSGIVPIVLASGVTLSSGTLSYYPASNINAVSVLNAKTTGSGQIGLLDTTVLQNGSYWIELQATDSNGNTEYNLALVTVVGNNKPGRVTATVTDLVVPASGLAIQIQRRYDSLKANTRSDFGYGWSLGTNVDLSVDQKGDVTFTLGGVRRTFYLAPSYAFPFPWYFVSFTPEPGLHGTLTDSSEGCPLDIVVPNGSLWECAGGAGYYNPPGYIYTDPTGTSYYLSATGTLQSIVDKNGNTLSITESGITSSTGLNVQFLRDSSGRITQITDPKGNQYHYGYDGNGNLTSVTYPGITQATAYTYDSNHRYTGGTDFRDKPLPTTAYYGSTDTDPNGLPLNGRIESVTDSLGEKTSYAYDLLANTTTITYPADSSGAVGHATMVYDNHGMLVSSTDPLNHTTTNGYDAKHNLTSVTDPMGQVTIYTYDQNGNQTSVTYPKTATSTSTTSSTVYNEFSEPTSTTDELGNVRTFIYDGNFNPQTVTDSLGVLASFQFNANGTMAAGAIGFDISQQSAMSSHFGYDADGNMISRTDALGRTTSYTYDSLGHKLTMTIPVPNSNTSSAAATTTYTYDALGNLTQTAAPLGRTTSSQYDGNGNKTSDTDANSHATKYQYDALNRLIETDYPDGTKATKSYDFRGNVVDSVDQAGHDTRYAYDLAGRLSSMTQGYGRSNPATTSYTYDNDGRKLTETDPNSHTTTYTYDTAGNLLSVSGPKGNFQYAYDDARNRTSMTDGNGNVTQYKYDARKRLVEIDYPDKTKVTNAYDGPGNLIKVIDQANNEVDYTYDAANQLKTVAQVNSPNSGNNTNTYGYDPDGNLISLTDANSHSTQDAYNLLYELTGKTLPDGSSTETRQYDAAGNLTSLKHFSGTTTTFNYDQLNRLLSRVPDSSLNEPTESFTYTATGKRATMTDASGTTNYTYDSLDRLMAKATPEGTLNYTYDSAGNLATMTSSDGVVNVSYTWDNLNRLSTVTDNRLGGSNVTTYTYDSANNLATVTYPNTLQSTFQYDSLNRLTSMTAANTAYGYTLGPTGIRTQAIETSGRTVNWSFDGIYRLTGETVSGDQHYNGSVGYGLDPVGNRLSANSTLHGVSSGGFSYNADDQLSGELYDANGNVTASGGKTFAYDSQNRLTSMNGGAVRIVYDGDGNRVSKTASGVTTQYLVNDLNPTGYAQVVEEMVNGAPQREYTYGLQRIDEDQVIQGAWVPSFYGYDGFGTVRQLTNTAGAVTDTYEYDAFGNEITSTGTTPNNYLYRGEQYDPDLGLYYLRARYYNPLTGRFMSRDPEDGHISIPVTLHKYLYASGNPVNRLDRSGKADEEEEAGLDLRSLTKSVNYAAKQLNIERQLFGDIIHAIKDAAGVGGATDLYFSIPSGDVYLLIDEEYELIDNVFGYM